MVSILRETGSAGRSTVQITMPKALGRIDAFGVFGRFLTTFYIVHHITSVVSEITVGIVYTIAPPRHSRLISRLLLFVSLAHLWLTVYLVWHSHMTITHGWNAHEDDHQHVRSQFTSNDLASVHLVRKSRSLDTQTTKSAKQHQVPTSTYRMKVKDKFLNATQSPLYLLHPTPPFGDRPVANVVLRLISFTATMSIAGSAKKSDQTSSGKSAMGTAGSLSQSQIDWDSVGSGALVRFWFPPYLNERHLKSYPLIINVWVFANYCTEYILWEKLRCGYYRVFLVL